MPASFAVLGIFLMMDIMFIVNFFFVRALRKWTNAKTDESHAEINDKANRREPKYKESGFETFFFGWILGKIKADPLYPRRFPNWKPIPWYIGVTTTSILLLISIAFLSPGFLFKQFGLSMSGAGLDTELCDPTAQENGLTVLNNTLKEMMNFDIALNQFNAITGITKALQKDVALYGTEKFPCPASTPITSTGTQTYSLTGRIEQWTDPDKRALYPAAKWGTFFPGYCRAFFDSEIKLAQLAVCGPRKMCKCPELPNTSPFTSIGLGGLKVCSMQICFTFDNIPCGKVADFGAYKDLFPPNNYRVQQLKLAKEQQDLEMNEQNFPNSADGIKSSISQTFTTILKQIDLASNIYAVYACLSLYFPAPIDVFREPYSVAIKGFFFGVQKTVFIVMVIAVWWAFDYINRLLHDPDIQLLFANIRTGDPCFLDGGFILQRQKLLGDLCDNLIPKDQNFSILSGTVTSILNEVDFFEKAKPNGCACVYPSVALNAFSTVNFPQKLMKEFNFTRTLNSKRDVFLPNPEVQFIGNLTVCNDSDLARKIILMAPDSSLTGAEIWFESGLISALVIKAVVANFVVALLKAADPFVVCRGEFMWIPSKFGLGLEGLDKASLFASFKTTKEASLWYINFRDLLFWGLIMHLALYNLMSAAYTKSKTYGVTTDDIAIMRLAFTTAGVVASLGLAVILFLRVNKHREQKKDTDTTTKTSGQRRRRRA